MIRRGGYLPGIIGRWFPHLHRYVRLRLPEVRCGAAQAAGIGQFRVLCQWHSTRNDAMPAACAGAVRTSGSRMRLVSVEPGAGNPATAPPGLEVRDSSGAYLCALSYSRKRTKYVFICLHIQIRFGNANSKFFLALPYAILRPAFHSYLALIGYRSARFPGRSFVPT